LKTRKRYLWGKLEPTKESLEDFLSVLDEVTQDIHEDLMTMRGLFEVDTEGNLMPAEEVWNDLYFMLDSNGDIMPKE